jgi:toxin ParE1/3/4
VAAVKRRLVYDTQVQCDIDEIIRYLAKRDPSLIQAFEADFAAAMKLVRQFPEAWTMIREPMRRIRLNRFSYHVGYVVFADRIIVLGVQHTARNATVWKGRVDDLT